MAKIWCGSLCLSEHPASGRPLETFLASCCQPQPWGIYQWNMSSKSSLQMTSTSVLPLERMFCFHTAISVAISVASSDGQAGLAESPCRWVFENSDSREDVTKVPCTQVTSQLNAFISPADRKSLLKALCRARFSDTLRI